MAKVADTGGNGVQHGWFADIHPGISGIAVLPFARLLDKTRNAPILAKLDHAL